MKKIRKVTQLSEKEKSDAKDMYLNLHSVTEIADKFGCARSSISYHANKYWKVELEMNKAELFQQFTSTKKAHFTRMSSNAMAILDKTLVSMASRSEGVSAQELKSISAVLESLDKITRLDDGKPTEITEEKVFDVIELRRKANLDPFGKIPEVDYKEVKDEESN